MTHKAIESLMDAIVLTMNNMPMALREATRDMIMERLNLYETPVEEPVIIRTFRQLKALDEETQLCHWYASNSDPIVMTWFDWVSDYEIDGDGIFPLAVIATGDQVRAARKALEEA